jgi:hypothetical protein
MALSFPPDKPKLPVAREAFKRFILARVPIGTDLEKARQTMENEGFNCQIMPDSSFSEMSSSGRTIRIQKHVDFLHCQLEVAGTEYCMLNYQVALVYEQGAVTDIGVSVGLVCL